MDEMECPDETFIASYIDGGASKEDEANFRMHLADCEICRMIVSETTKSMRDAPLRTDPKVIVDLRPSQAMRVAESLDRGRTFGRYLVLDVVGAGGMGVVYAAYDPELDRKVALKLLRPREAGPDDTIGQEKRLLREAQAMARLQHESVVAVYDAGSENGQVYLAMEFVSGSSLGVWQTAGGHDWRDILAVYIKAGRGLAAAHAAHLVHRDFKPDNVLVAKDGRVRVTDFGLARAMRRTDGQMDIGGTGAPSSYDVSSILTKVAGGGTATLDTKAGTIAGTPAYMAPEQMRGDGSDAKSDQFSFAVALYEALYKVRPFDGATLEELLLAIETKRITEPLRGTKIPPRVRKTILRALDPNPDARFPSIDALLTELSSDPRRIRRRVLYPVLGAALLVAGAVGYREARREETQVCGGIAHKLTGVWDADRKHEVESAFLATAVPFAADAWKSVAQRLDDDARRWIAMRLDACEDTLLRHEQPETTMTLRYTCLDDRLQKIAAMIALFTEADGTVVEHSVAAVESLPSVEACENVKALAAGAPVAPVGGAATTASEIRRDVARASALEHAGKFDEGSTLAKNALDRAHALGYPPLEAEALLVLGRLEGQLGDANAGDVLLEAASVGASAGEEETTARAWIDRAYFIGYRGAQYAGGERWLAYAEIPLARLGKPDELEAERLVTKGDIEWSEGKLDAALADMEKARTLFERNFGEKNERSARTLNGISVVYMDLGRYDDALDVVTRAAKISEATLGSAHPELGLEMNNMGNALWLLGRYPEALTALHRSLDIWTHAVGRADHPELFAPLDSIGSVLTSLGRYVEAEEMLERARAILDHAGEANVPEYASVLNDLGVVARLRGDLARARELHGSALEILERSVGKAHGDVGMTHLRLAEALIADHKWTAAHSEADEGVSVIEAALGPGSPSLAVALTVRGEAELGAGATAEAAGTFDRALTIRLHGGIEPKEAARTNFDQARALWARNANGDREHAKDLAEKADAIYRTASWFSAEHATVTAWVASRS